ncbi:MAG: hypothetical protein HC900_00575 [Methylacidiphilales bacterium]|nr:hypothetical protein [Candidatus Methylacidiphilales bacterium]
MAAPPAYISPLTKSVWADSVRRPTAWRVPPVPALEVGQFLSLDDRACGAVGRLDGVTTILPSTPLFLLMYVRKEALPSSPIEGTQSFLSDRLLFENDENRYQPEPSANRAKAPRTPRCTGRACGLSSIRFRKPGRRRSINTG